MIFDWQYAWNITPVLAEAALVTIQATFLAYALALIWGLMLAVLRMSRIGIVSTATFWAIEVIRGTPLLVQLFILFLILPRYGLTMPAFTTGVVGLALHYSAYCAEVYRAGIESVPRDQWEASRALNLNVFDTFRDIIMPQAIPPILPALGNYLISLFKETPLLSAVAVVELMQQALLIGSDSFRYTEPITLVGGFFLCLSLAAAAAVRWIEVRIAPK